MSVPYCRDLVKGRIYAMVIFMKQLWIRLAALGVFALPAYNPALADYEKNGKTVECYCTDTGGAHIDVGETICLQVDGRMFMAQCQMSLNVPMWREMSQGCLSSQAAPLSRFRAPPLPQSREPGIDAFTVYPKI